MTRRAPERADHKRCPLALVWENKDAKVYLDTACKAYVCGHCYQTLQPGKFARHTCKPTFPRDRVQLNEAGFSFKSRSQCRGCHAPIEWWITPNGKLMPWTADELTSAMTPHHSVCPKADQFRRRA